HVAMPCKNGADAFDVSVGCLTPAGFDVGEPCTPPDSPTRSCIPPDNPSPACTPPDYSHPPCCILLGHVTHLFTPSHCPVHHTITCNLVLFSKVGTKGGSRNVGLARGDLPDRVLAIMGSRLEHASVPASRVSALAKRAKLSATELRTSIDV